MFQHLFLCPLTLHPKTMALKNNLAHLQYLQTLQQIYKKMMTKKRARLLKRITNLNCQTSTSYQSSKIDDQSSSEFISLQDSTNWAFRKLNSQAASFHVSGNKVTFGLPKYQVTIYPHQAIRLNTGWQLNSLPQNTSVHTIPNQYLLNYNLLAFPEIKNFSNQGEQMTINLLNNGQRPVSVIVQSESQMPMLCIEIDGKLSQLQFDFGSLFTSVLSAASTIVPLFM